uniref:Nondiscriminating glutamyl-tRNA synthetase EARS2, mitochondrial n=1 Tax=Cacopsylla melanoneura TaxID=428564 RepID=A0A8D8PNI1_9HEMI
MICLGERVLLKLGCSHRFLKVYCHSNAVRVRFAPSPTGLLHLGGLRTALYNYFFAKSQKGSFILRIEDTDQTRIVPEAVRKLEEDLKWIGIVPDESETIGGQYGPYLQSKRLDLYQKEVETLLNNGSAYKCFCSDSRLNLIRKDAVKSGLVPKYDNKCRNLTNEQVEEKLKNNSKYCIRFKLSNHSESWQDLVYGDITYNVFNNEGDPVIIKSDGFPTYHFANVVDDHHMNISHVLRGVEWQISTTKHILIYKAFGWNPPKFAHLPLLLNLNGTKLSKRQGDMSVEAIREGELFPNALVNFVTNFGGGFHDHQRTTTLHMYTMRDLIEKFDLSLVNENSCKVDPSHMKEFNRAELKRLMSSGTEEEVNGLVEMLRQHIVNKFPDRTLQIDNNYLKFVLDWSTDRIFKLEDLVDKEFSFIWVKPSSEDLSRHPAESYAFLSNLIPLLISQSTFTRDSLATPLKQFSSEHSLEYSQLMKLLRTCLSGLKQGPSVGEMMEILGKENTIQRLRDVLEHRQGKASSSAAG